MAIFQHMINYFKKVDPSKLLEEEYSSLNQIAHDLRIELKHLRNIQKSITDRKLKFSKQGFSSKFTGKLGSEKTLFIEEDDKSLKKYCLINRLKKLESISEKKFVVLMKNVKKSGPLDPVERSFLRKINDFLLGLRSITIPACERLTDASLSDEDRLLLVEKALREVSEICKKYHEIEKKERAVAKKIDDHKTSSILKRIYEKPDRLDDKGSILVSVINESELRRLQLEAEMINACHDPDFKVFFRHWWRDIQVPEIDETTPLKDPHVNVTIKLFGSPKKNIHLIVKKSA